jgi:hypothetical protein
MRGVIEELERLFYPFGYIDIYHDAYDWFIIFDSKSSAIQAQRSIYDKNQHVLGYPIDLSIPALTEYNALPPSGPLDRFVHSAPPYPQSQAQLSPDVAPTTTTTDTKDVGKTAKQILFEELADIFLKDVKNRIAGPCIYDFLRPSLIKKQQNEEELQQGEQEKKEEEQQPATTAAVALELDIVAHAYQSGYDTQQQDLPPSTVQHDSIYKLPRFKKKSISQRSFKSSIKSSSSSPPPPPLQHSLTKKLVLEEEDDEKEDVDIGTSEEEKTKSQEPSPLLTHQQQSRRLSDYLTEKKKKPAVDSSSEDDDNFLESILPLRKKQKTIPTPPKRQQHVKFGLYDDGDSDSSDDMTASRKRSKSPAITTTTTLLPSQKKTTNKKVLKQRRPLLKKKTSSTVNMVIEETPHQQQKMKTPSTSSMNSPSTNMDIDIDGDDDSDIMDQQRQEDLKSILSRRDNKKKEEEEEFDQATLEKMLQDVDEPDKEEELWNQYEEPTVELSKEFDPFCQTKDVEDLEYLRVAIIEKVDPSNANTFNNGMCNIEKSERVSYMDKLIFTFSTRKTRTKRKENVSISKNKMLLSYS